jgi:hypothetical protein
MAFLAPLAEGLGAGAEGGAAAGAEGAGGGGLMGKMGGMLKNMNPIQFAMSKIKGGAAPDGQRETNGGAAYGPPAAPGASVSMSGLI